MNNAYTWNSWDSYLTGLPNLIIALIVLLVGWLLAKAIGGLVENLLKRTKWDNKFFANFQGSRSKYPPEKIIGKVVYYLILVFVFILFFNILSLNFIASPLVTMLSTMLGFIPNVLKAALILLLAWVIASVLRMFIIKVGRRVAAREWLQKGKFASDEVQAATYIDNAAKLVFYLVLLMFIPGVLNALNITGVSGPFSHMVASILAFIPKLFAAALILLIGWIVAKIVRDIVTNFLLAIGTEKLVHRLNMSKLFQGTTLSSIIGTIIYVLILIPVVISALEKLNIRGITEPAIRMLNTIITMIPNIVIAVVLILVGIWIGKWVATIVTDLLSRLGFNSITHNMTLGSWQPTAGRMTASQLVGYLVHVIVVLLFVVEALQLVKLNFLVTMATAVVAYLPNVLAAIVIVALGLFLGNIVKKVLMNILTGPDFTLLASIAKYTIVALAFFMALDQLGVAATIVNSAFILILGGVALAFGLAFGLGGKNVASNYLNRLEKKIDSTEIDQEAVEKMKEDSKQKQFEREEKERNMQEPSTTFESSDFRPDESTVTPPYDNDPMNEDEGLLDEHGQFRSYTDHANQTNEDPVTKPELDSWGNEQIIPPFESDESQTDSPNTEDDPSNKTRQRSRRSDDHYEPPTFY